MQSSEALFKFQVNPNIKFEVFIHKVDGLSDDHKIGKDIVQEHVHTCTSLTNYNIEV